MDVTLARGGGRAQLSTTLEFDWQRTPRAVQIGASLLAEHTRGNSHVRREVVDRRQGTGRARRRHLRAAQSRSAATSYRAPPRLRADDAVAAVAAAQAAFPAWSAQGPGARRAKLNKAADLLEARAADFAAAVRDETGSTAGWGHFNVHFAARLLREAASMTTQVSGEVVPSDVPGNLAMAHRQPVGVVLRHRTVECAGDPRRARRRHAAGLRQHGGPQILRGLSADPPADRPGADRSRPRRWRRQRDPHRRQGRRQRSAKR